jgi:anthranilate phosphoribosyltransferase
MRDMLSGKPGADRDYTLVNAGAALVAANRASSVKEGAELARQAVDSGAAAKVLEAYVAMTQSFGG